MRIICGEHEFVVHVHLFNHLLEILAFRRFFHGLCAEPEMISDVFRRFPFKVWHFHAQLLPCCIKPPDKRWEPCESTFNEDDLEVRETVKYAFNDVTDDLGMEGLRHTAVVFDVIGGPPGTAYGTLIAPKVDTDR